MVRLIQTYEMGKGVPKRKLSKASDIAPWTKKRLTPQVKQARSVSIKQGMMMELSASLKNSQVAKDGS